MTDPHELLRAANPVTDCPPPPIEPLWSALERDRTAGTTGPSPRRSSAHRWTGRLTLAVGASFSILVGVGAVILLSSGGQTPRTSVLARPPAGATRTQALIDILAVLRRPQAAGDRNAPRPFGRLPSVEDVLGTPIDSLSRLASVAPWGVKAYLVPYAPPTARQIRRLPARVRSEIRRTARGGLAVIAGHGACCLSAATIEAGHGVLFQADHDRLVVVVPDGVARVTLGTTGRHGRSFTAAVRGNVVAFQTSRSAGAAYGNGDSFSNLLGKPGNTLPPAQAQAEEGRANIPLIRTSPGQAITTTSVGHVSVGFVPDYRRMVWYGASGEVLKRFGFRTG
jgi:hypothetical protein